MLLTVGIGAVLLLVDDAVVDVAGHALIVLLVVVVVGPPSGGFLEMQSFLLQLPPAQMLPQ